MKTKTYCLRPVFKAVLALIIIVAAAGMGFGINTSIPIPTATTCIPGSLNFAAVSYQSSLPVTSNYIITSEAAYLADYSAVSIAGSPTPTPVPVDFNAKMVVGFPVQQYCQVPSVLWNLTGVTTDCQSVILEITRSTPMCSGVAVCDIVIPPVINWYTVDKSNLPVFLQDSVIDCSGVTTTTTAPFTATFMPAQLPAATPTPYINLTGNVPESIINNLIHPRRGDKTTVWYKTGKMENVKIVVYNRRGTLVKTIEDYNQPAGEYTVEWNGSDVQGSVVEAGIYMISIKIGAYNKIEKVAVIE
ncbi:MAG: FlgD immunoglobulin-like domain containing protein [Candidatus Goldiibacteriota bacterium]